MFIFNLKDTDVVFLIQITDPTVFLVFVTLPPAPQKAGGKSNVPIFN